MGSMRTSKASIGIQVPIEKIFRAIVEPEQMSNYFISKGSAKMVVGKTIEWEFPEFNGTFEIKITELEPNSIISFVWDPDSVVRISLQKESERTTVVHVTEIGHKDDPNGTEWAIRQTEGWANFLACLKAWLEYGIHLRKGAFDFMNH